jgi:hypothetical protein
MGAIAVSGCRAAATTEVHALRDVARATRTRTDGSAGTNAGVVGAATSSWRCSGTTGVDARRWWIQPATRRPETSLMAYVKTCLRDLGRLRALIYVSDRGCRGRPRTFIHFMRRWPRLACDRSGRQLFIIGGNYRVTPRGIEG